MALSDYLTGEEWDACFYLHIHDNLRRQKTTEPMMSLGDHMHYLIAELLRRGYKFSGLDENGNKKQQVCDGINAAKFSGLFFGEWQPEPIRQIMESGRNFMKQHCAELVFESDEDWNKKKE